MLDAAISADKNISLKKFQKLSKYKNLESEVTKMWEIKNKTIPVAIGALGTIKKGTQNFIDQTLGKPCKKYNAKNSTHKYCSCTTKSTLNVNTEIFKTDQSN